MVMHITAALRCLVPLAAALALLACGNGASEKVVATVNGAPVTAEELQREVAGYGKSNRVTQHTVNDQLKVLIEQKLLIQEAVKMGLSEDRKFAETIKAFWEQTIIRNLIDAKTRELSTQVFATDSEVAQEYERMKGRLQICAVRGARTPAEAEAVAALLREGRPAPGMETLGPLFYEDLKGSPLAAAFDLKEGQVASLKAEGEYVVIGVLRRESVPLPPRSELERRIRDSVLLQKRQKALAGWIAQVKGQAKIRIDEKELRSITHE